MTVKEWLNRGYRLDKEINALLREQKRALDLATKTTAPADGEKVQTSKSNISEARFINYADYKKLIDDRIAELYAIKQEIITAINSVGDNTLRQLLIHRYIEFKHWEKIAEDMNYSYVHVVHTLHPKALSAISKNVNRI